MKKLFTICLMLLAVGMMNAQTTLFTEDFDTYTAGQYVNTQQPLFYPWTGATAEKAYVSDVQSHSPSNSMKIINDNDMVFNFGPKTSGEYDIKFWMYVVSGKGGYFNVEHNFGTQWAFSFYFKPGGTCDIKAGGQTYTFNYTLDTWMDIHLNINLETDQATAFVGGTQVAQWTFSWTETTTTGNNRLDVINFYGLHTASTGVSASEYYIDDFEYIMIQSGLQPATIDIDNTDITVFGQPTHIVPFGNTGEEVMDFLAFPYFTDPSLTSTLGASMVSYDQGSASAIGWASEFEVYAATRFLPDMMGAHVGQVIESANIFINDLPVGNTITVYVWERGGYLVPGNGTQLAEKTFTVTAQSDNTIVFDTPITITGDELWIGYKFTTPANLFTLGTDDQTLAPHTSYLKVGPVWEEFDGVGGNMQGNFCIRANVTGQGWPVWLSVTPFTGTVAPAGSQDITLAFNTTGLVDGSYDAYVVVGCNDPTTQWTEIFVTLDVITGIENNSKIGVMTFPNPSSDFINVVSDFTISNVTVYDINGKVITTVNPSATNISVDVNNFAAGTYVFEITAGNETIKRNIVVK
jgi:hypothetical protein